VLPEGYEFDVSVMLKMAADTDFASERADVNMAVMRILAEHDIQLAVTNWPIQKS
jgi:MscS family membrane protein